ncbi:hypothetical protein GCM10018781_33310 [Kitasatospora indigofera]|uniref:Uncharacterized protein n=1 Tax=Kitasatospora indigofera TaxID=67307 RepID=A0A919FSS9_9ACTN|nr:hypothetical protein [Kitasatospora indigofera]GHH71663.1 hypothetical protein GCM10018781_33310 [Kitasatospora indigofera]
MDLDQVADELYGLAPADFTAARDEAAGRARRAGDRALAERIRALRRPTTAAWLANLLVRAHPTETAALLDLGQALRAAQDQLAGAELRDLLVRRHQVVLALVAQALDEARNAGRPAGDGPAQELTETLEAALADPSAAAALAAGRLGTALGPGAEPSLPTGGTKSRPTAAAEAAAVSSPGAGRTRGESTPDEPRPGAERDRSEAEAAEEARLADLAGQVKRARKDAKQAEKRAAAAQGEADRAQYAAEESDEAVQRARAALEQARAAYGTTSAAARARREEAATAATRAGEAAAHADRLTRQFEALKKRTTNHGRR